MLGAFGYVSAIFPNYPNATIPYTNQDPALLLQVLLPSYLVLIKKPRKPCKPTNIMTAME